MTFECVKKKYNSTKSDDSTYIKVNDENVYMSIVILYIKYKYISIIFIQIYKKI